MSPCARCRCGPTWRPTSRPTMTPMRRPAHPLQLPARRRPGARARRAAVGSPAATAGAQRPRGPEWRTLDRVLVWAHWSWFMVPHGAVAYILVRRPERFVRAALMTYAVFDLGASFYWIAPTAPPWYAASEARRREPRASGRAADDGGVRRGVLERRLGLALQCLWRQSSRRHALASFRHIADGRAPAR